MERNGSTSKGCWSPEAEPVSDKYEEIQSHYEAVQDVFSVYLETKDC